MQKLFIISILCAACCAVPQDLSGKMFTFPVESNTAHVRLLPSRVNFKSVTVCLRYLTDLTRNYALFSMASRSSANDFLIFKTANKGRFDVHTRGKVSSFRGLPDEPNTWYSSCSTWDSNSGLAQVWINGNPSTSGVGFKGNLDGAPNIVLGQEQDSVGGGFDAGQSFVGMITDVHMWDYALSACELQRFASDLNFTPGDVINWRALDFTITGDVVVEDDQISRCLPSQ
ncbi:mucosal pentraxin-like isoform X2 [Clupea harengus]|uniref:Pentraxin family member n=1 Tax=Clupea harengus TaxID=7950 RepID=A0A6P3WAQ1_CLUHA|nr:mucosal pentraxin-like isoform X2 [Clupea harengus]XP_031434777.1 mucosal pentraxin-like isoform X2 [Clupea harengus]